MVEFCGCFLADLVYLTVFQAQEKRDRENQEKQQRINDEKAELARLHQRGLKKPYP